MRSNIRENIPNMLKKIIKEFLSSLANDLEYIKANILSTVQFAHLVEQANEGNVDH